MSFIAENPISAAEAKTSPPLPKKGTRGLFPKEDGWYEIDDQGNVKKIAGNVDQELILASKNAVSGGTVYDAFHQLKNGLIGGEINSIKFSNGIELRSEDGEGYGNISIYLHDGTLKSMVFIDSGGGVNADYSLWADMAYTDGDGRILKGSDIDVYWEDTVENADVGLMDGISHYFGLINNSLICSINDEVGYGFSSALYFATPSEIPKNYSQFPDSICFKGDSTYDRTFVPEANMRYTIYFDFDGYMLNGYVSGVEMVSEEETV